MRKYRLLVFVVLFMLIGFGTEIKAETGVRYTTLTISNGEFVMTQTAYIALSQSDSVYGVELDKPNDIFIDKDNYVYIVSTDIFSDTGKIIKFNLASDEIEIIGEDFLIDPTGIFVNDEGEIFVADRGAFKAYKLDASGEILLEYVKPTSPIFGFDEFQPRKIVSDSRGNVYILNNGTKGLVQFGTNGDFLGYFGTNYIAPSFRTILQYTFFSDEQRENLFNIAPPEISNVAIDGRGLIHTTSLGVKNFGVKRLNISGDSLLPGMVNDLDLVDLYVGPIGNIYVISESGFISEYDIEGNLLFRFGGQDESNQIKGLFNIPSAIAVDDNYNIYVLDSANKELQIFIPTEFASLIHTALFYYQDGKYIESKGPWEEVLKMNDLFDLAHRGLGNAYYSLEEYDKALIEYEISYDRAGYSNAYWEVRNEWLLENIGYVLTVIFSVLVLYVFNLKLHYFKYALDPIKNSIRFARKKSNTLDEILYVFTYLRNPADATYYIKRKNRVGVFSASILLVIYFLFYIYFIYNMSFLFNFRIIADINVSEEMLKVFLPLLLWVGSNYLVSSIREGEGRFRDIYVTTIFSVTPFFITLPIITILSHGITYNEEFIISASTNISIFVTLIYFFFMVKETQYYQVKETIVSIFVSFFTMIMILLGSFIVYILLNELFILIKDIVMEVFYRE